MKKTRLYQNTILGIDDCITLDDYASHHLKVLRFPKGQNITLFNGDGANYNAQVLQVKKNCVVKILEKTQNHCESKLDLTLAQAVAKGEKMDFLVQKAVELGVNKIIPIFSERCVVRLNGEKLQKRLNHWQKIIIAACEQSGRSVVPNLELVMSFEELINSDCGNGFVLHHRAKKSLLEMPTFKQTTIIIGPEGGLSKIEINRANKAGYRSISLGARVLRTETATLAAIANMQLLWGS